MVHLPLRRPWLVALLGVVLLAARGELFAVPSGKPKREVADQRKAEAFAAAQSLARHAPDSTGSVLSQARPSKLVRGDDTGVSTAEPDEERSAVLSAATDAVGWLKADQNPSGSWGSAHEFVDTCAAMETLGVVDAECGKLADAASWLSGQVAGNYEYLARKIVAVGGVPGFEAIAVSSAEELLAARSPAELDNTLPNYPEGGWGVAAGYETDCLTTALGLLALDATGYNGGFEANDVALAADTTNVHEWDIPLDATQANIYITVVGTTVHLRMAEGAPPMSGSGFSLAPGNHWIAYPDSGLDFTPGHNYIVVQDLASTAGSYSITAAYVTPTFSTLTLAEPLDYLREAQNGDGGWGLQRGTDTEFFTTLHVLRALLRLSNYDFSTELADGIIYLQSQQLGDGSFGYGGVPIPYVTALAADVLVRSADYPFSTPTEDAISTLRAMQNVDSSWDQEPYDTALGVMALWDHNQTPTVDGGPDQSIDGTPPVCAEEVALSGSASDVDGVIEQYIWSIEGLHVADELDATVVLPVGEHSITLTATDDLGKRGTDTISVVVLSDGSLISPWALGDSDCSGAIDLDDYAVFPDCLTGPVAAALPTTCTYAAFDSLDFDADLNIDLYDHAQFQLAFGDTLPTGACCLSDGSCVEVMGEAVCAAGGGVYQGAGTDCVSTDCPEPQACCYHDGSCQDRQVDECVGEGGVPQGTGTTCAGTVCEPTTEACCFADGTCQDLLPDACVGNGGTPRGEGTTCASVDCPFGRYSNEIGTVSGVFSPGSGVAVGDDMMLAGIGARALGYYDLLVYGGGGGSFDTTVSLYTDCPGNGGTAIAGTGFIWADIPDDGYLYLLRAYPDSVTIPDTAWMVVSFSTNDAGWAIAEDAEIGFTEDRYGLDLPPWECHRTFLSPPDPAPHAGFWANLECSESGLLQGGLAPHSGRLIQEGVFEQRQPRPRMTE